MSYPEKRRTLSSVPETCSDSAFPVWYGTNADRRNRSRRPPNNSSSSPISFSLPQPGIVPPSGNNLTDDLALTWKPFAVN